MFIHHRSQSFVLKKEDRGESDQLFTVYTKEFGKLKILGRAVRKITSKLRGSIDVFSLSEIEFIQGKALKTLTDAVLIEKFSNLRKDLKKVSIASKVAEVLDGLILGQEPDEKIWRLLKETFDRLDDDSLQDNRYPLVYFYFLWNFFLILGYCPELHCCSICRKKLEPKNIFFDINEGLVCDKCHSKIQPGQLIEPETVKAIRFFVQQEWLIVNKLKIETQNFKSIKNFSNCYLASILEKVK